MKLLNRTLNSRAHGLKVCDSSTHLCFSASWLLMAGLRGASAAGASGLDSRCRRKPITEFLGCFAGASACPTSRCERRSDLCVDSRWWPLPTAAFHEMGSFALALAGAASACCCCCCGGALGQEAIRWVLNAAAEVPRQPHWGCAACHACRPPAQRASRLSLQAAACQSRLCQGVPAAFAKRYPLQLKGQLHAPCSCCAKVVSRICLADLAGTADRCQHAAELLHSRRPAACCIVAVAARVLLCCVHVARRELLGRDSCGSHRLLCWHADAY